MAFAPLRAGSPEFILYGGVCNDGKWTREDVELLRFTASELRGSDVGTLNPEVGDCESFFVSDSSSGAALAWISPTRKLVWDGRCYRLGDESPPHLYSC